MPSRAARRQHVLVVDDDEDLRELLSLRLEHNGYEVVCEQTCAGGMDRLEDRGFDAMILDLRLPDGDGLSLLPRIKERRPDLPVIMLTAHGSIESAVEAMRLGAFGFLTKPFLDHDLLQTIRHAVETVKLRREVADLRRVVGEENERFLIGTSAAMRKVREVVARVGPTEVTVLITGESGTGKELAARSIHDASPRARGPFVAINCAAMPEDLLESELFGHVKGAFTGALRDKPGLFAAASGSTLFLDEIGDAPLKVQAKLLRVLQEKRYTRVGSTKEEEADVRVLAATNRDLKADVAAGRFREDLFYRLHVFPLEMPPLRAHPEDVPVLAQVFLERAGARHGLPVPRITKETVEALVQHQWPGNVRELAHVMEAALLYATDDELRPEHLRGVTAQNAATTARKSLPDVAEGGLPASLAALTDTTSALPPLKEARDAFDRAYVMEALKRANGNVSAAARTAGRNRTDFYELMRRLGISPGDFKP
jgi:two-component system response regulator GlrR